MHRLLAFLCNCGLPSQTVCMLDAVQYSTNVAEACGHIFKLCFRSSNLLSDYDRPERNFLHGSLSLPLKWTIAVVWQDQF